MKPCVKCDQPRMRNLHGIELTMCEDHQREYWRENARKNASKNRPASREASEPRVCIVCGETKTLNEFAKNGRFYRHHCKPCWSAHVTGGKKGKPEASHEQPVKRRHGPAPVIRAGSLPSDTVIRRPIPQTIVIVDRVNNSYLMCDAVSETPIVSEGSIGHVIGFYQALGYRVVDGIEEVPAARLRSPTARRAAAGD